MRVKSCFLIVMLLIGGVSMANANSENNKKSDPTVLFGNVESEKTRAGRQVSCEKL